MRATIKFIQTPFLLFTLCLIFLPTQQAAAAGTLNIKKPTFADSAEVRPKIKAERNLPEKLSKFTSKFAKKEFDVINIGDKADNSGKVLTLEITNLKGTAGGAWSGAKSVTVAGKLSENGKVIGSFKGRRSSGGGGFGGYKGTCSILGRCVKSLGKDIAKWMAKPTTDASIGELK